MAQQIKADKDYTLLTSLLQVADIFVKIRERKLLPRTCQPLLQIYYS